MIYETKVNAATLSVIGTLLPWLPKLLPDYVRTLQIVDGVNLETLGIGPSVSQDQLGGGNYAAGRVFVLDEQGGLMISVGLHHVLQPAFLWAKERQVARWRAENLEQALLRFPERALLARYVVHIFDDQAVLYKMVGRITNLEGWLRHKKGEALTLLRQALKPRL